MDMFQAVRLDLFSQSASEFQLRGAAPFFSADVQKMEAPLRLRGTAPLRLFLRRAREGLIFKKWSSEDVSRCPHARLTSGDGRVRRDALVRRQ